MDIGLMDAFFDYLGLYRSDVAKDATCLYRSVAEQLFYTQSHHDHLKKRCIEYMQRHRYLFEHSVDDFDWYLERLSNDEEWAGPMEMTALSLMYRVDFILYRHVGEPPIKATGVDSNKQVVLAEFSGNRYDCVYTKSYLAASAICQSITYEVLYKDVFGYGEDIHVAVEKMLHDKQYSKQRKNNLSNQSKLGASQDESKESGELELPPCSDIKKALAQGIPPFPYKVAKTLDPNIYRNVEFDIWNEEKKETLRSEQYIVPNLAEGVKCKVNVSDNGKIRRCTGHVQELHDDQITVYVEELCRRCVVKEDKIEVMPVPAYKALTWHGGKTYRVNSDDCKTEPDQKSKNKPGKRSPGLDSQWILPPVDAATALANTGSKDKAKEQIKSSSGSFFSSLPKGQFRQYSSSFSTPKSTFKKQGYHKPRSSSSMTSYKEFCASLHNATNSDFNEGIQSTPIATLRVHYDVHVTQNLVDSSSSCSSGYHSSSSQNTSGENSDMQYQTVFNNHSPVVDMSQDQQCYLQFHPGYDLNASYTSARENIPMNSVGSAAATSLPLQIPRPAPLKNGQEDGNYQAAQFPIMSSQVTVLSCPLYHSGYIVCGSDGQQLPINIWPLPPQSTMPDLQHGMPSMLINTPPTSMSPPVTQVLTNYMQAHVPHYNTSWTPAVHQNFLSAPPAVLSEMPYSAPMVTPPWSPPSNFIIPAQQCPVPSVAPQPPFAQDQQWSVQSI